jgi:hypothetical protein
MPLSCKYIENIHAYNNYKLDELLNILLNVLHKDHHELVVGHTGVNVLNPGHNNYRHVNSQQCLYLPCLVRDPLSDRNGVLTIMKTLQKKIT